MNGVEWKSEVFFFLFLMLGWWGGGKEVGEGEALGAEHGVRCIRAIFGAYVCACAPVCSFCFS